MKIIKDLDIREVIQPKTGNTKRFRFALFLCPVCGCEAERKKADGIKQKRCCGGKSKIAPKGSPLHNRYISMTQRCFDKNASSYNRYGGRGISVCKEWMNFDNFARWCLSNGFSMEKQLDRIDGDKDYSPGNCRFITVTENQRNKSACIHSKDEIAEIIRLYVCTPISFKELAIRFNDSPGNIANIIRKRSWNIDTEWDRYIDAVVEIKKTIPSKVRKMWMDNKNTSRDCYSKD